MLLAKKNVLIFLLLVLAVVGVAFAGSKLSAALVQAPAISDKPNTTPALAASQPQDRLQHIVLGAGCFWGAEKRYENLAGVTDAVSGYAGGVWENGKGIAPNYKEITRLKYKNDPSNHAEVVRVTFDPSQITVTELLKFYFETHNPTQKNRQGNDIGTQYRSVIFTTNDAQMEAAKQVKAAFQTKLTEAGFGQITTQIQPLTAFYPAEAYHQDYLTKNPNGYCPDHSTGVTFNGVKPASVDNAVLMQGKHIVIIDADYDCPYCRKFKKDVLNDYAGDIPVSLRLATQLEGLQVVTPAWATPTVLFLENGKEVAGFQGYMTPDEFYKALGAFKLGESEAYAVAFSKGTDSRFCKQYEKYKHTPEGYFVDTLSGDRLFDTRDRFDSGSGWLSFTKAVDGAVTYHEDNSLGMQRTEIRAAKSGIHLGHVFDDGPNGQPRYCINATVLEFEVR